MFAKLLAFFLSHAPADSDDHRGVGFLNYSQFTEFAFCFLFGFGADAARDKNRQICLFCYLRWAISHLHQQAGDLFGVVLVHLASPGEYNELAINCGHRV